MQQLARRSLPAGGIERICALDIEWARRFLKDERGVVPHAARSSMTGEVMNPDEIVLMMLHQLRTALGTAEQVQESYAWLRARRYQGLFGELIGLN